MVPVLLSLLQMLLSSCAADTAQLQSVQEVK